MIRDLLACFIVMAVGVFLLSGTMLSHDISWYLISTRWWLNGLPIYEQILELNPPLAFYLTAIPVLISSAFGLSAVAVYKAFVFGLITISLMMCQALLSGAPTVPPLRRRLFLGAAAIGLILLPIGDFGQRDHLFAIFFLPFVAMSMRTAAPGRTHRAAIATWAVLGIALKHYFLVLPLLILSYKIIIARSLRPIARVEYLLPAALLIAYVAATAVVHPAYFDRVIPLTFLVYGAYDAPFTDVLARVTLLLWILSLALVLMAFTRRRDHSTTLAIIVALGAIAVFLIQSKGWNYHRIPADLYVLLALTWAAAELAIVRRHWWPMVPAALCAGLLLIPALRHGPYQNNFAVKAEAYFDCPAGERSFQIFSSTVSSGFPLANYAQAEPANRAPTLWLFAGATDLLSKAQDPAEQAEYRAVQSEARALVLKDFFRARPQVVLVDVGERKSYFNGAKFDYLDYFREDQAFADAWSAYHLRGKVANYDIYARDGC